MATKVVYKDQPRVENVLGVDLSHYDEKLPDKVPVGPLKGNFQISTKNHAQITISKHEYSSTVKISNTNWEYDKDALLHVAALLIKVAKELS